MEEFMEENFDFSKPVNEIYQEPIGVYVKLNEEGFVTDVSSDIFITNFEGWQKIDEGYGDRFAHAQSQYFGEPISDLNGKYFIKIEKTEEI